MKLRRFTHGTNKQANGRHSEHRPIGTRQGVFLHFAQAREHFQVVERAGVAHDQTNAENKTQVRHAVDEEGFFVRKNRAGPVKPETDEQVGCHTHGLPADKQLQQVVAHHQQQHGKGKQADISKKAVVAGIAMHIARGVNMHHERDESDHAHEQRREAVDHEADFHLQAAHAHPLVHHLVVVCAVDHLVQRQSRQHKRDSHRRNGDAVRGLVPQQIATRCGAKNAHHGGSAQRHQQRGKQQGQGKGMHHAVTL